LNGPTGPIYYDQQKVSPDSFQDSMDYDIFWNFCLIISYQLLCIESLYLIFQKSKMFKVKSPKGQPDNIAVSRIIQNVTSENEGRDLFAIEFRSFCELFDNMITVSDKENANNYNLIHKVKPALETIIFNFQKILFFLLNPKQTNSVFQNPLGNSPIYRFIRPADVIINDYELEVTDKEIDTLRENVRILQDKNAGPVNHSGQNTLDNNQQLMANENTERYSLNGDKTAGKGIKSKGNMFIAYTRREPSSYKNRKFLTIRLPPAFINDEHVDNNIEKSDLSNNSLPTQDQGDKDPGTNKQTGSRTVIDEIHSKIDEKNKTANEPPHPEG
jgi:hypothetical protein